MSILKDLLESAKEQALTRLASPLLGGFVISWCLWNYKFLVILFSKASLPATFELIERVAFPDYWASGLRGLLYPLLTTAAYIFVYPYPAKFVYGFTQRRQKEINALRRQIEDETPLTLEESRRLRAEVLDLEAEHQKEIDRLGAELARVREQLEQVRKSPAKEEVNVEKTPSSPIRPRLTKSQWLMLGVFRKHGGDLLYADVVPGQGSGKVQVEYDLGELKRLGLLDRTYDQDAADYRYELTHEGRAMVLAGAGIDESAESATQAA